jgi:myo-inositol-1(or 4)-monophosphatase
MNEPARGVSTVQALEAATRAARAGGEIARARLGRPGYVTWKGPRDVTSEASLQVQEAIVSSLLDQFPDAKVLAEEGPDDAPLPVEAGQLWIVDPVCGSLNFVQGIPAFGVSIALRSEGRIRAAVVYDPCRDELFAAATDSSATLNGETIGVQQLSEGTEAWSAAVIGTDWPRHGERRHQAQRIVGLMVDQVSECALMGSPALGICYVAAGRLHAYWHLDLRIWDLAAASLILERAGGVLTDAQGMTWLYSDGGYLASNGVIHGSALNCIQAVLRLDTGTPEAQGNSA